VIKRITFCTAAVLIVSGVALAQTVPVPDSQQYWAYSPTSLPVKDANPSSVKPLGVGSVATGGGNFSLRIGFYQFAGPVDIYCAISAPSVDPANLYILKPDNTFQLQSMGVVPWKANTTTSVDETPFGTIPTSGLPSGIYHLYIAVTPAGDSNSFYFWGTYITVVKEASCSAAIPVEAAAQGNYRTLQHDTGTSVGAVAIAKNGWRAVAGGQDNKIYYFKRSQASPVFTYATGGQVNSVAISRDGRAFAAGSQDGRIYFFECDQSTPAWTYDTALDISSSETAVVEGVDISKDGRWIAAVSRYHVYLFGRNSAVPLLKQNFSSGTLATVAISADGSHLVAGTMPEGNGSRVFYLNHLGIIWTYSMQDLGWGPNDLHTPVAISADGRAIAAGGRDNRVHFWSGSSSTPLWTYQIAQDSPVFSIAY